MERQGKVFVYVYRDGRGFSVTPVTFSQVPSPGEHVFLWLSDEHRKMLGVEYASGSATPALVRDTIPRPVDPTVDYWADIFVEAIPSDQWTKKYAFYGSGGVRE
jgi:hypothetical protein